MPTLGETRDVSAAEGYLPGAAEWKAASFVLPVTPRSLRLRKDKRATERFIP